VTYREKTVGDLIVIGGGIAGSAAGYFLARHAVVTLLEAEPALGVHATGRSAAWYSAHYGPPAVRALTAASRSFYTHPPRGFAEVPLLRQRDSLAVAPRGANARREFELALRDGTGGHEIDRAEALRRCPLLRRDWVDRALLRTATGDLDVAATQQGFVRGLRAAGGTVARSARVLGLDRRGGRWHAYTTAGEFTADVIVDAAGGWADEIAMLAGARPLGIASYRRTAVLVPAPPRLDVAALPMLSDITQTFYAKPESGGLLLSPVDATPMPAGDVRPDDLDVALAVERVEAATTLRVRRVSHRWAGLRSSAPDDLPVIGPDPRLPGFAWLAGLGGYGIQAAPAMARLLADLLTGVTPRIDPEVVAATSPDRAALARPLLRT
jgi:D-arginine dehydrogenase